MLEQWRRLKMFAAKLDNLKNIHSQHAMRIQLSIKLPAAKPRWHTEVEFRYKNPPNFGTKIPSLTQSTNENNNVE